MKVKDASDNNVNETEDLEEVDKSRFADLYVEPVDDSYDADDDDDDYDFGDYEEEEEYNRGSKKGHLSRRDRFNPDIMRKIWKPGARSDKRW